MAKIKNVSGEARHLPWLGGRLVQKNQVFDVPEKDVTAYTQQVELWVPADAVAQRLHDEMLEAIAYLIAVENPPIEPTDEEVRAVLGVLLAETSASELITGLKTSDERTAAVLLELEQEAEKPRTTVITAAEKRLAELNPPADDTDAGDQAGDDQTLPDGDQASGTTDTPTED
jgi:CRP-like cAMP-binding protein